MTEFQRFLEQAIARAGSVAAPSRATGNTVQNFRKWRTGEIREPSRDSLRRLGRGTDTSELDLVRMVYG